MITKLGKVESLELDPSPLISRPTSRHKSKCLGTRQITQICEGPGSDSGE